MLLSVFPPPACCWRTILLYGRMHNCMLGVWGLWGGFHRVIEDVLPGASASSALLAPRKLDRERWAEHQAGKFGGKEGGDGASEPRCQDGNNCQPHSICRLVPGGQLQNRITGT